MKELLKEIVKLYDTGQIGLNECTIRIMEVVRNV